MRIMLLAVALVWLVVFSLPDNQLHLIACDVGQGDATLITYANKQILVDGGPNRRVLDCLSKHLPFWDRQIEVVVLTHPDKDHYGGLREVFKRYKVVSFISNQEAKVLERTVGGGVVKPIVVKDSLKTRIGPIYLDMVSGKDGDDNETSIVSLLKFGRFKALLTADAPATVLEKELALSGVKRVNYLKVSHHGSKSGLTQTLLEKLRPQLAVISVGKNSYGHPTQEILDLLAKNKIKTLRTDQEGDIIVVRPK